MKGKLRRGFGMVFLFIYIIKMLVKILDYEKKCLNIFWFLKCRDIKYGIKKVSNSELVDNSNNLYVFFKG